MNINVKMLKFMFQGNAKVFYSVNNYWDNSVVFIVDEGILEGYINEESTYEFKVLFKPVEEIYYETVLQFSTIFGLMDINIKGTGNIYIVIFNIC